MNATTTTTAPRYTVRLADGTEATYARKDAAVKNAARSGKAFTVTSPAGAVVAEWEPTTSTSTQPAGPAETAAREALAEGKGATAAAAAAQEAHAAKVERFALPENPQDDAAFLAARRASKTDEPAAAKVERTVEALQSLMPAVGKGKGKASKAADKVAADLDGTKVTGKAAARLQGAFVAEDEARADLTWVSMKDRQGQRLYVGHDGTTVQGVAHGGGRPPLYSTAVLPTGEALVTGTVADAKALVEVAAL